MKQKLSLQTLLGKIDPKKRKICFLIKKDFATKFETFPGSISKHQWWPGGYRNHLEETMNIAVVLFDALQKKRGVPFSLSDALFILFIHDLDKLISYKRTGKKFKRTKRHEEINVPQLLKEKYSFRLNPTERNAIRYIHGENQDSNPRKRVMLPLTAFVHCCDILSARVWYEKGRNERGW